MMNKNRRKVFINNRIKAIFTLFFVLSFLVAFVFLGWDIFIQYLDVNHYEMYETLYSAHIGLILKTILLIFWIGFTLFSAYYYMEGKYNGIFARMDRLFNDISKGEEKKLFFRDGDSFAYLAESFNRMVANLRTQGYVAQQEKLKAVLQKLEELSKSDQPHKQEIENIIEDIKKFL